MSDLLKGLAQLKQVRQTEQNEPTPVKSHPASAPERRPGAGTEVDQTPQAGMAGKPGPGRGEEKTLAGRVPLALHRELAKLILEAADDMGMRRIYIDEALEAAVRIVIGDQAIQERWKAEVQQVRMEKAGS
ncbi:hypothetical protein [Deinococcus ficus]|uniref:Uncharacterized protein n=1 Tax=Deinococcus ficus TaxID=317577 RepID=A0A221T253_9DEIO|nr:hypothetical protein [Deinococcus ficus]ASN82988.1 hypothetical protein DFI_17545 [Deinococcus ficus]GHF78477.1 hypothetical protein GCM10017782_15550 [Deinococcus ficus]